MMYQNSEGYPDPTAAKAMQRIRRQEVMKRRKRLREAERRGKRIRYFDEDCKEVRGWASRKN